MAKSVQVLLTILDEDAEAYKIETEDMNRFWLAKKVITNNGGGCVGATVVMDVLEYIAIRSRLI